MTRTFDLRTQQPSLEELLDFARAGDEVILQDGETPVAKLSPCATNGQTNGNVPQVKLRVAGLHRGKIWVSDDFDAPMSDQEFEEMWNGDVFPR